MDIGGYHLYDASQKTYTIPIGTTITSHANSRFIYSITKIVLNNTGYESITLTDRSGAIVDTESYSGTQRDDVVIYLPVADMDCTIPVATGSINTGVNNTGITNS